MAILLVKGSRRERMKMFSKVNFKFSLLVKKLQYQLDHCSLAVTLHAWSIRSLPCFLFMLARLILIRRERMTFNPLGNLSNEVQNDLTTTRVLYWTVEVIQLLWLGAINFFDGISTKTACLFVKFLLLNSKQWLEYLWLHTTKIWTIIVNGAGTSSFIKVYTPSIWTH